MNYENDILEALFDKGIIDEELYLKCKPKYISGLPGDLRSTDVDLLKERYDATMKELRNRADTIAGLEAEKDTVQKTIDKAMEENDELQKNLDKYEETSDRLVEESNKSKEEALDELGHLMNDDLEDLLQSSDDLQYNGWAFESVEGIMDFFELKGYLTSAEVDSIYQIADNIVESLSQDVYISPMIEDTDGYDTLEAIEEFGDTLKGFADRYDINNSEINPIGDTFQEVMTQASQAPDWRNSIEANDRLIQSQTDIVNGYDRQISSLEREMDNLLEDSRKTQNKIRKLENR